mmetsp:Transcript_1013/g.1590  ORF Transcript_1013/g.1590 Transcript_1013/m.1590 type:complete len:256 (-) Transcript_1013:167-934(-)
MELDEFVVLIGKSLAQGHCVSVSSTSVCRCAGKVSSSVPARGQDGVFGLNTMKGTVFHVECHDPDAFLPVLTHQQIQTKILDKVRGIKCQGSSVESVEHGMSSTIGGSSTSMCLSPFAVMQRLTAECSLVDLSFFGSREGHSETFQLQDSLRRLSTHVMNGVLVAQPIAALDGIVHVPAPVVFGHVAQGGIDASLRRHGVTSRGKQLGDAGRFESGFAQTHGGSKAGTAGPHHHGVVLVIDHRVIADDVSGRSRG